MLSLGVLAVSITVHEYMHGLASYRLGDNTAKFSGRLSLNPLRHIDIFTTVLLPIGLLLLGLPPFGAAKPIPFNPHNIRHKEFGIAIVAAAGPLSNLLLAVFGGLIIQLTASLNWDIWITWWWLFIVINIGFFIFNLIPFPPLDGSRILYAFAPEFLQRVMAMVESMGLLAILVFMVFIFPLLEPVLRGLNSKIVELVIGI